MNLDEIECVRFFRRSYNFIYHLKVIGGRLFRKERKKGRKEGRKEKMKHGRKEKRKQGSQPRGIR